MIELKNIKIENNDYDCFICLYNDGDIHDFPCKNCKLKIHLKCLYDYLNQFENNNICSVCKNEIIIDKRMIIYENNTDSESDTNSDTNSDTYSDYDLEEYTFRNRLKIKIKRILNLIKYFIKLLLNIFFLLLFSYFIGYIFFKTFNLPLDVIRNDKNLLLIDIVNFFLIGSIFGLFLLIIRNDKNLLLIDIVNFFLIGSIFGLFLLIICIYFINIR
jgi:hypothetical protein